MNLTKLIKQLLPKGRAFRFPAGGNAAQTIDAVSEVYSAALSEVKGILDTVLPDNDNFTAADASIWERRLGLTQYSPDLTRRKQAIMRKLNFPGECLGRLSKNYIESQLRAAGFDVYVHQNKFSDGQGGWTVINPGDGSGGYTQHGLAVHGIDTHGSNGFPYDSRITNHVNKIYEPTTPYTATQLRATFFICGSVFPNFAYVPAERERELRQLILTLKAQHTVGFLIVQYT